MSTALILIDIQNDYFPGGHIELAGSTEAAAAAARLFATFRQAGWPVFHIQHESVRRSRLQSLVSAGFDTISVWFSLMRAMTTKKTLRVT